MIINYGMKQVQTKIVYYGPAMSGKTTSLKALFKLLQKGEDLQSIETTTGRTLFFDFGSLDFKGSEWNLKINLYTTTGQDFYQATRPSTLANSDAIVFIVDSQKELLNYNVLSWKELRSYFPKKIKEIPIAICLNKRDLQNLVNEDEVRKSFNLGNGNGKHVCFFKSIATKGNGIKDSFKYIMNSLFPQFTIDI